MHDQEEINKIIKRDECKNKNCSWKRKFFAKHYELKQLKEFMLIN